MAIKSTVIKVKLEIADMDRHYYQDHHLTLARHPSETDQRLMARIVAFTLNASDSLSFSSSLSSEDDEPELSDKSLTGDINLWVAFGTPDEKWLRKASNRAREVQVFAYGTHSVPVWWKQNEKALARYHNLKVWELPEAELADAAQLVSRGMKLQCNISEGQIWLSNDAGSHTLEPIILKDLVEDSHP